MTANNCISVAYIKHCCNRFSSERRMHDNERRDCNIVKEFVEEIKPHLLEEYSPLDCGTSARRVSRTSNENRA